MSEASEKVLYANPLETTIRIGIVLLLAAWCFQIIQPFVVPIVWGVIIAIAVYPVFLWVLKLLSGRRKLAAALVTILGLLFLITPTVMLSDTLVGTVRYLAATVQEGTLSIPPPPDSVAAWPLIGKPLHKFWSLASVNLEAALVEIGPQLKPFTGWLLGAVAGTGLSILIFIVSIVISGFFLATAESGYRAAQAVFTRLAGDRGPEFAKLAETTVRSVARGILGVAFIQSLLAGIGFMAAGVPGAGFWAVLCLLLSVIQIGPTLVLVPSVIYVFSTGDTLTAVVFTVWSIFVGVLDNILKPILLGRGVNVPMAVIFIGAIGGFLSMGIIGLFVGSIVLVLGYTLFMAWLKQGRQASEQPIGAAADSPPGASNT